MTSYEIVKNVFDGEMIKKTDQEGKESWIPVDPANSDYQEYLKSLDEAFTL